MQFAITATGQTGIVGHNQQTLGPLAREIQQKTDNPSTGFGIEITGRLIGENNIGIVDLCACDRDALLFAAGKFRR